MNKSTISQAVQNNVREYTGEVARNFITYSIWNQAWGDVRAVVRESMRYSSWSSIGFAVEDAASDYFKNEY
jgi:hypothetical protein